MISEGHAEVDLYTIGQIWDETEFAVERINRNMASETVLLHMAISTAVAAFGKDGGKKAFTAFRKKIEEIIDDS